MTDEELVNLHAEIDGFLASCEILEKYKKTVNVMEAKMIEHLPELKQKVQDAYFIFQKSQKNK